MTLRDNFEERYSTARVLQLTNPDETSDTMDVDDQRLDAAVADAEGEFQDLIQATYDDTNPRHVTLATALVEVLLIERGAGGVAAAQGLRDRVVDRAQQLKISSTLARTAIESNSRATAADSWSSPENFRGLLPTPRGYRG